MKSWKHQIFLLAFLQLWYFVFWITVKPFKKFKDNAVEILNEGFYGFLWISLTYFGRRADWEKGPELAFLTLILANNLLVVCVILLWAVASAWKYKRRKFKKVIKILPDTKVKVQKIKYSQNTRNPSPSRGETRRFMNLEVMEETKQTVSPFTPRETISL